MVNVVRYTIHGWHGYVFVGNSFGTDFCDVNLCARCLVPITRWNPTEYSKSSPNSPHHTTTWHHITCPRKQPHNILSHCISLHQITWHHIRAHHKTPRQYITSHHHHHHHHHQNTTTRRKALCAFYRQLTSLACRFFPPQNFGHHWYKRLIKFKLYSHNQSYPRIPTIYI